MGFDDRNKRSIIILAGKTKTNNTAFYNSFNQYPTLETNDKILEIINKNIKIMVVDDEPKIISVLKRLLRNVPYPVSYFSNPKDAITAAESMEYSLVVSDNMMPGMSGLDLCNIMKKLHPQCMRLLLTGATAPPEAITAFNEGIIHRFIAKPWDNTELLDYIRDAINTFRKIRLKDITAQIKDRTIELQASKYTNILKELKQTQTQLELHKFQQSPDEVSQSASIMNLSFMVVEQHRELRDTIVESLKKAGVSFCISADSGNSALHYLSTKSNVDVVLSDWDMAGMDGLTLLKHIRQRTDIIPQPLFILIATQEHKDEIEYAFSARVDGYIIKPFQMSSLVGQIETLAQKKGILIKDRKAPTKTKKNRFLIAGDNFELCNIISNILITGGIEQVIVAHSGKAAFHILKEKKIKVLFYHDQLNDPHWKNLEKELYVKQIDVSDLKIVISSYSGVLQEEIKHFKANIPTTFLSRPLDRSNITVVLSELLEGFKLSDFNIDRS